jgi:hypothetical protein
MSASDDFDTAAHALGPLVRALVTKEWPFGHILIEREGYEALEAGMREWSRAKAKFESTCETASTVPVRTKGKNK